MISRAPAQAHVSYQGLAMMQVTNNSHIPDELWVVHHAGQELIVVVGLQRLLLQQLGLLGFYGCNDGDLPRHKRVQEDMNMDFHRLYKHSRNA